MERSYAKAPMRPRIGLLILRSVQNHMQGVSSHFVDHLAHGQIRLFQICSDTYSRTAGQRSSGFLHSYHVEQVVPPITNRYETLVPALAFSSVSIRESTSRSARFHWGQKQTTGVVQTIAEVIGDPLGVREMLRINSEHATPAFQQLKHGLPGDSGCLCSVDPRVFCDSSRVRVSVRRPCVLGQTVRDAGRTRAEDECVHRSTAMVFLCTSHTAGGKADAIEAPACVTNNDNALLHAVGEGSSQRTRGGFCTHTDLPRWPGSQAPARSAQPLCPNIFFCSLCVCYLNSIP